MRLHAPHASAMGKRDAGSDAPAKASLLFTEKVIRGGRIRPRPHADGLTRGNPERCRRKMCIRDRYNVLFQRISKLHWDVERALTTPVKRYKR